MHTNHYSLQNTTVSHTDRFTGPLLLHCCRTMVTNGDYSRTWVPELNNTPDNTVYREQWMYTVSFLFNCCRTVMRMQFTLGLACQS